jgi:hypothetical protein
LSVFLGPVNYSGDKNSSAAAAAAAGGDDYTLVKKFSSFKYSDTPLTAHGRASIGGLAAQVNKHNFHFQNFPLTVAPTSVA